MSGQAGSGRRVTRDDVARYAGVSTAVVSYVLNNSPKAVAPETRTRVLDAVDLLGYRPNAAARALSRGTADLIAMVVPDQRNPYFAELVTEVDRAARASGKSLLILSSEFRRTDDDGRLTALTAQQADGLVIADAPLPGELEAVDRARLPAVFVNQFQPQGTHASLGSDYAGGAAAAVEHLIALGHRDVAFIGHESTVDPRERGWAQALADAGLPRGPVLYDDWSLAGGYRAGLRLAAEHPSATAVFAASDQLAMGAIAALHASGRRVPGDVSVVGFDGTEEGAYLWPPLTTVSQDLARMAADAVALLAAGTTPPGHTSYPTALVLRGSTAPVS